MVSVFYCAHLCMKCCLGISNFLEEISSISHSIVFLCLHCSLKNISYLSLIFFGTLHSDGYIFLLPCTISINRAIMLSRLTVVYIIILLCSKHFDGSFAIRVEAKILTIFIKCKYNAFNNVSPVYSYYCTYPLTSSHADFFDLFLFFLLYNTILVLPYIDMNPAEVYMSSQP